MKKNSKIPKIYHTVIIVACLIAGIFILDFFNDSERDGYLVGQATKIMLPQAGISEFTQDGSPSSAALDRLIASDSTIPLDIGKIYSISISAKVNLESDNSLVRVILVSGQDEYLVYEGYPDIASGKSSFVISKFCEETCALEKVQADALKIQVEDAAIDIKTINFIDSYKNLDASVRSQGINKFSKELKDKQDKFKIKKLNEKKLGWTAGETSVSQLSYQEKKKMIGNGEYLPNLNGFEFYKGGIFEIKAKDQAASSQEPETESGGSSSPASWDWRDRHSQNWVTPVKNQGSCGSCWAFSAVGATEGVINMYYNQKLDINLAEQDSLCRHPGSCANGGYLSWTYSELRADGLVDEQCMPYKASDTVCNDVCILKQPWEITNYGSYANDDETIKNTLINKGTVSFGVRSWWHFITLVGYFDDTADTVWIIKNSWGTGWGEDGYANMIVPQADRYGNMYAEMPFFSPDPDMYQVQCVDNDNDTYCTWGLSNNKPASCPSACNKEKDCDDSNPSLGPFDLNFNCIDTTTCHDSDGGKVYSVYGQVTEIMDEGVNYDYCLDESTLREVYCSNDIGTSETYTCPDICVDGACVTRFCEDSDGGKNYDVAGEITGYMIDDSPAYDYCIDSTQLYEVYCFDDLGFYETHLCSGICQDDRCVTLTPPAIAITAPAEGLAVSDKFITTATSVSTNTKSVDFYIDGNYKVSDSASPFKYKFNTGIYKGETIAITAVARADNGLDAQDTVNVKIEGDTLTIALPECNDGKDNDQDKTCDYAGCRKNKVISYPKDQDCISSDDISESN